MTDELKAKEASQPDSRPETGHGGATTADKIALGVGVAAALGVATGLFIARQSARAMRKYIIRDDETLKDYWQLDYSRDSVRHTRYFHGTEAAAQRRMKFIQGEDKSLTRLEQAQAEESARAQNTHIIEVW